MLVEERFSDENTELKNGLQARLIKIAQCQKRFEFKL